MLKVFESLIIDILHISSFIVFILVHVLYQNCHRCAMFDEYLIILVKGLLLRGERWTEIELGLNLSCGIKWHVRGTDGCSTMAAYFLAKNLKNDLGGAIYNLSNLVKIWRDAYISAHLCDSFNVAQITAQGGTCLRQHVQRAKPSSSLPDLQANGFANMARINHLII